MMDDIMRGSMTRKPRLGKAAKEERTARILAELDRAYPNAECALHHRNAFELLVATILSAQCTDERVNLVTRELFRKYRKPQDYIAVQQGTLEEEIRSTGFYRNKAKSLQGACRIILEKFGGEVPPRMEDLLLLPGVARKTANVVLGVAFGKAEGIVVDTHVQRVSKRLELASEDVPEKIERELMNQIPRDRWIMFSHQMILHGRRVCKARKPFCQTCPVASICRSEDKTAAMR